MSMILTLNGGSSSIKFALYQRTGEQIEKIAGDKLEGGDQRELTSRVVRWLELHCKRVDIESIGHRLVTGGNRYLEPAQISPEMLSYLKELQELDPDHLPREIAFIETFAEQFPNRSQVACFDTAFHSGMPRMAQIIPIPRHWEREGIRRYGFHGISYEFLLEELTRRSPEEAKGRVILAHLGSGSSLAAVRDGQSRDTSMGFTPTSGVAMSTRSGDLDPSLAWYFGRRQKMTLEQFHAMVNRESGLLGISQTSSDLRVLLEREGEDNRAAEAVSFFCYQIKKTIGAYSAVLEGLDTLVFSGGVGENIPAIRERICSGLNYLGVDLDPARNRNGESIISKGSSAVTVRVIRTDEENRIATEVARILNRKNGK